jgi:hypothetical protein
MSNPNIETLFVSFSFLNLESQILIFKFNKKYVNFLWFFFFWKFIRLIRGFFYWNFFSVASGIGNLWEIFYREFFSWVMKISISDLHSKLIWFRSSISINIIESLGDVQKLWSELKVDIQVVSIIRIFSNHLSLIIEYHDDFLKWWFSNYR